MRPGISSECARTISVSALRRMAKDTVALGVCSRAASEPAAWARMRSWRVGSPVRIDRWPDWPKAMPFGRLFGRSVSGSSRVKQDRQATVGIDGPIACPMTMARLAAKGSLISGRRPYARSKSRVFRIKTTKTVSREDLSRSSLYSGVTRMLTKGACQCRNPLPTRFDARRPPRRYNASPT